MIDFVKKIFFLWKLSNLLTITLFTKVYSTYISYNPIWRFYTEQKKRERKATYNAFSKELIKDKRPSGPNTDAFLSLQRSSWGQVTKLSGNGESDGERKP